MELLERDTAVEALEGALAQARAGTGRIVLVAGEAGVGKSALTERVARAAGADARFLWGACDPLLTPRALGPIHDIARQAGGALTEALTADAPREAVFAALLDELDARVGGVGVVLVVEDLHWADEATLDALVVVGRRIARTTGTLLLTYRSDEIELHAEARAVLSALPSDAVRRIDLAPLSPHAVEELARRAGQPAEGLHAATGGNAFLVTEVLAAAAPGIPASVRALVGARLARLSPSARAVAEIASVVPTRAEPWLLRGALEADPGALDECVATGLLAIAGDSVSFRHDLARAAVESELSPSRRRELHLEVLAALGDRSSVDPARLSHHARLTGDAEAILRHAPAAARAASALGAHRQAFQQAEAALDAATELGADRAELLELLSTEAYLYGHSDRALAARREALAIHDAAGRPVDVGESLRWLCRLYWWSGDGVAAERAGRRAIEVLEPLGPSPQLAMAYSSLAQLHMLAWRHEEAVELGSQAIALARELGDDEALSHALTNVGTAWLNGGERAQGRAMLKEAFARAADAGFHDHAARALVNLAYVAAAADGAHEAEPLVARALAYAREHELGGYTQYLLGMRAMLRLLRGDWPGAEADAHASLERGKYPGISLCPALVALGTLQARRGDPGARATLDDAWARAQASGELQRLAPAAAARLECAWLEGSEPPDLEAAREVYARALEAADPFTLGELAFRLWLAGDLQEISPAAAEPYRLAAEGDWSAAAAAWEAIGRPYDAAEVRSLADDDELLLQALAELDRIGAAPAATRLRRRLRERGVTAVPRGPRAATRALPHGLTPRQLEVLGLIATGATNAEIAERLVVSPKTVDHHVSAVLAKLEVGSRREAADVAQDLGIGAGQGGEAAAPR
jgi:DNA-binding CsgD family transcriptional regulator/tetratricopeptide (TPR) repeat protein